MGSFPLPLGKNPVSPIPQRQPSETLSNAASCAVPDFWPEITFIIVFIIGFEVVKFVAICYAVLENQHIGRKTIFWLIITAIKKTYSITGSRCCTVEMDRTMQINYNFKINQKITPFLTVTYKLPFLAICQTSSQLSLCFGFRASLNTFFLSFFLFFLSFFFFFKWPHSQHTGQGSNPRCSCNLHHSFGNARSLTYRSENDNIFLK